MTFHNTQSGHRDHRAESQNVTVWQPEGVQAKQIYQWAKDQDLVDEFQILFAILGMDLTAPSFTNWCDEVSAPEAEPLLAFWERNTLVERLVNFARKFSNSSLGQKSPPVPRADRANNTKVKLKARTDPTALLALIVNPLDPKNSDEVERVWPRSLRIWLVLQAADRMVRYNNPDDRNIDVAARFLTIDNDDPKWDFISALLKNLKTIIGTEPTFGEYSNALISAIESQEMRKPNRGFLSALQRIARGENAPTNKLNRNIAAVQAGVLVPQAPPQIHVAIDDYGKSLSGHIIQSYDPDETELVIVSVDPTDTPEEQIIESNSFFVRTAEGAHFLRWTWEKPLPSEIEPLKEWINTQLNSAKSTNRLGAAATWLALELGRSLHFTLQFKINVEPGTEWTIHPDFFSVARIAPERQHSWKPKSEKQRQSVQPTVGPLTFTLPSRVGEILKRAYDAATADQSMSVERLSDLWRFESTEGIETWLNNLLDPGLSRVSSGTLRASMGQHVFNKSADSNLARLMEAHPTSALPAACGYAVYSAEKVQLATDSDLVVQEQNATFRLLGSHLAPKSQTLIDGIDTATKTLFASRTDLVRFHNNLATYTVTALCAATGSRHLKDPFEHRDHFCFDHRCVFIDDKSSGESRQGRLVPLPEGAKTLLDHYLNHLEKLADALENTSQNLAQAIREAKDGSGAIIPLFFSFDQTLQWHSLFDSGRQPSKLFEWSLPRNVFRHWYGQQLAASNVDREIIDGFMGHSERDVATYGDSSARHWQEDADNTRIIIENIFKKLPFKQVHGECYTTDLTANEVHTLSLTSTPVFGQKLRKQRRSEATHRAKQNAEHIINTWLLSQHGPVSPDNWEGLINRLTHTEVNLAHPYAIDRLNVLESMLDQIRSKCDDTALQLTVRAHRITPEESPFTPFTPLALAIVSKLKDVFTSLYEYAQRSSQLSLSVCLGLGAVLLCLEVKLSYHRLVVDVARNRNFRLVVDGSECFLEYNETLDKAVNGDWNVPVQRHRISHVTAKTLARGSNHTSRSLKDPWLGEHCQTILSKALEIDSNTSANDVLIRLCQVFDAANPAQMPGLVAAALSGRQPPTSIPMPHLLRTLGRARIFPNVHFVTQRVDVLGETRSAVTNHSLSKHDLQQNALAFINDINAQLNAYDSSHTGTTVRAIDAICRAYGPYISQTMLVLGGWISYMAARGYKTRRSSGNESYQQSSLLTYFSVLGSKLRGLAYAVDILNLDDAELTELYQNVIDVAKKEGRDTEFLGQRLWDFHHFAQTVGVAEPDWGVIDIEGTGQRHVRPGFIGEQDYLECMRQLQCLDHISPYDRDCASIVWLLCYRFGLRASEAINLTTLDWRQTESMLAVLVRNNRKNRLKTSASRRPIPLLFPLTDLENAIIERVILNALANGADNKNQPLLSQLNTRSSHATVDATALANSIPQLIIRTLRHVSGLPDAVLHHARHSFFNRIAPLLYGVNTETTRELVGNLVADDVANELLSGSDHIASRRAPMGMARLMGHVRPKTGQKSYNHMMTIWADSLHPVTSTQTSVSLPKSPKLFRLNDYKPAPETPLLAANIELPPVTLRGILQTLRLASFGKRFSTAATGNFLSPEVGDYLESLCTAMSQKMRFDMGKRGSAETRWTSGADDPLAALKLLSTNDWSSMLAHARDIDSGLRPDFMTLDLPPITELSCMVGKSRQLLMSDERQAALVLLTLKLFRIESRQYAVAVKHPSVGDQEWFQKAAFAITPTEMASSTGTPIRFDPFELPVRHNEDRRLTYAALVMKRTSGTLIANGIELMVAVIATAGWQFAMRNRDERISNIKSVTER